MLLRAGGGSAITHGCMMRANLGVVVPSGATFTKIPLDTIVTFPNAVGPAFDTNNAADPVNNQIIVPRWAKFVSVTGHIGFPTQAVGAGYASIHLFRNPDPPPGGVGVDGPTPEAYYHNRFYYPLNLGTFISGFGITGKIPVAYPGESWTLYASQTTGGAVTTIATQSCWLNVGFFER